MNPSPSTPPTATVQGVVDALSLALGRSVLLDDPELAPLAHSRQWDVDAVRSESILSRGAAPPVRAALLAQGIAAATDVIHTAPDVALGMEARVCMPVREGPELLGYLWLLDPREELGEAELERVRQAAAEVAALLLSSGSREIGDEAALVAELRGADPERRRAAASRALETGLLVDERVVVCLLATTPPDAALGEARRAARRLSVGHAVAAGAPEGAVLIAAPGDPVLRNLPPAEVARWLRAVAAGDPAVAQSEPVPLDRLDEGFRQAALALRAARARGPGSVAAWPSLGADRLIAQLPAAAAADVPARLAAFLAAEPGLAATLDAYLTAGGDVKATAAALSLHRSGLYYRLGRIEELTGLDLGSGEDRLLAQLAIRLARFSNV